MGEFAGIPHTNGESLAPFISQDIKPRGPGAVASVMGWELGLWRMGSVGSMALPLVQAAG